MKAIGIVRQLDDLGRVSVPAKLRRSLGIQERDSLEFLIEGDNIILRRYNPGCSFCGGLDKLHSVDNIRICKECAEKIKAVVK